MIVSQIYQSDPLASPPKTGEKSKILLYIEQNCVDDGYTFKEELIKIAHCCHFPLFAFCMGPNGCLHACVCEKCGCFCDYWIVELSANSTIILFVRYFIFLFTICVWTINNILMKVSCF